MLSSFHFNGHTPVFHRQTSKCEPPCKGYLTVLHENLVDLLSFEGRLDYLYV